MALDVSGYAVPNSFVVDKLSCHPPIALVSDGVVHCAIIIKETSTECGSVYHLPSIVV